MLLVSSCLSKIDAAFLEAALFAEIVSTFLVPLMYLQVRVSMPANTQIISAFQKNQHARVIFDNAHRSCFLGLRECSLFIPRVGTEEKWVG